MTTPLAILLRADLGSSVCQASPAPDPATTHDSETDLVNPFALLAEHPDINLVIHRLQDGERGRWYPDLHVIILDDRLTEAERRCVLMHELVHRTRGDVHVDDALLSRRQEKSCHETAARLLIPLHSLARAMQWGYDPEELAEELWVDVKTLRARILGLDKREVQTLMAMRDPEIASIA